MSAPALKADILLLSAAAFWGAGFVAQKAGMDHMGPLAFTGLRFLLGAAVLIPLILVRDRLVPAAERADLRHIRPRELVLASVVLTAAAALQQAGIAGTTAGKAGFITALYVILVPILGLAIGHRTRPRTWLAAAIALVGLVLLSAPGLGGDVAVAVGDLLVLSSTLLWATHVLILAALSPRAGPLRLAAAQFALAGGLALAVSLALERPTPADLWAGRYAVLYSGVFAVAVAFTLQIAAQRTAPPAHVAILLSTEAIFAVLFGWLLLGESMAPGELAGAGLMLVGVVVSQWRRPSRRRCGPPRSRVK